MLDASALSVGYVGTWSTTSGDSKGYATRSENVAQLLSNGSTSKLNYSSSSGSYPRYAYLYFRVSNSKYKKVSAQGSYKCSALTNDSIYAYRTIRHFFSCPSVYTNHGYNQMTTFNGNFNIDTTYNNSFEFQVGTSSYGSGGGVSRVYLNGSYYSVNITINNLYLY